MHTAEGQGEERRDQRDGRVDRIGIGGGDDSIARIQLAARWSEAYAPAEGDSLGSILRRFRAAYEYLDAVTHGVEPPALEEPQPNLAPTAAPPAPSYQPPPPQSSSQPEGQASTPPEPRPWA